jgi:tripartite ATP-independent transporter DctP family solute receptor
MKLTRRQAIAGAAGAAALTAQRPAFGQATTLKWAHVYETNEPYHTEALWAAQQIQERTGGKFRIEVFPASQLGNEPQINEGLGLGTVDIIYTGTAFAGSIHRPLAITGAPYILRNFEHWRAYRDSPLFRTLAGGYENRTRHKITGLTYYGERHVTANRAINRPEDMRGMKLRVPQAPMFLMFARSVGANATPIAFAEVYLALQQGTVDGQENPLPTIMAKKFYEVQSHINLTGHITDQLVTIVGAPLWGRLSEAERTIFNEVTIQAAARSTEAIRRQEGEAVGELRRLGKTVVEPDKAPFRAAAQPLLNDQSAGAGWSRAEYDQLQALAPQG